MEKSFAISEKTMNALLGFLQTCRYDQVAGLIQTLSNEVTKSARPNAAQQQITRLDSPVSPEQEEKKA